MVESPCNVCGRVFDKKNNAKFCRPSCKETWNKLLKNNTKPNFEKLGSSIDSIRSSIHQSLELSLNIIYPKLDDKLAQVSNNLTEVMMFTLLDRLSMDPLSNKNDMLLNDSSLFTANATNEKSDSIILSEEVSPPMADSILLSCDDESSDAKKCVKELGIFVTTELHTLHLKLNSLLNNVNLASVPYHHRPENCNLAEDQNSSPDTNDDNNGAKAMAKEISSSVSHKSKPTDSNSNSSYVHDDLLIHGARSKNLGNTKKPQICNKYKFNKCTQGTKCSYPHPRRCRDLIDQGACGTLSCKFYHPPICRNSIRERKCLSINCNYSHIKGTIRSQQYSNNTKDISKTNTDHYRFSELQESKRSPQNHTVAANDSRFHFLEDQMLGLTKQTQQIQMMITAAYQPLHQPSPINFSQQPMHLPQPYLERNYPQRA